MGARAEVAFRVATAVTLAVMLGVLLRPAPEAAGKGRLPGPWPAVAQRGEGDAVLLNAGCEGCHADIAEEQRASLHHASAASGPYVRALAIEPLSFCKGCHAPEADPDRTATAADRERASMGVACVTCHLAGPTVLAAPANGPPREGARIDAPHGIARDARFGDIAACAACHEFPFPELGVRRPFGLMQSTVAEHARSPYASFACADCHMPRVKGPRGSHRSHRFVASRSEDTVRAAVDVSAERPSPTTLRVTLAPRDVGHAFPTGDLFRRVTVSAWVEGATGAARAVRTLRRRFGEHRIGLFGRPIEVSDDRVGVGSVDRVVDLDLGREATALPVRFRVDYERVAHPSSRDGEDAVVDGFITLAEGVVPADATERGGP